MVRALVQVGCAVGGSVVGSMACTHGEGGGTRAILPLLLLLGHTCLLRCTNHLFIRTPVLVCPGMRNPGSVLLCESFVVVSDVGSSNFVVGL